MRFLLSPMANTLFSMLYQAVRGNIILGWVTFPGYVPYRAMVTLPKPINFTVQGKGITFLQAQIFQHNFPTFQMNCNK